MTQTCIELYSGEYDADFLTQYNALKYKALEDYNHEHYYDKYCCLFNHVVKHHKYLEDHIYFREIVYIQIQQLLECINILFSRYTYADSKEIYLNKLNKYIELLYPYIGYLDKTRTCAICGETLNNFMSERNHMWIQHSRVQNSYTNHSKNKEKWLRRSPRIPKYIYKHYP